MALNVRSFPVPPQSQEIIFEKPISLCRIFFRITVLAGDDVWRQTRISFDGPQFDSFYSLDGPAKHFEIQGEGIPQGDVWVRNTSTIQLYYTGAEILI